MVKKIVVLKLVLLFLLAFEVGAQRQVDNFINSFDEISDENISAILQDKFDFVWFATKNGLVRFDGYKYKNYSNIPHDSSSISFNWITDITQDDDGNIWIATFGGGLNFYNRLTEKFTNYTKKVGDLNSISSNTLSKVFFDSDKNLWIATEDGLNLFDKKSKTFKIFNSLNSGITTNYISSIAQDDDGNIWIGSMGGGVFIFDKSLKKTSCYINNSNDPTTISNNNIRCITRDSKGTMWLGTVEGGLNQAIKESTGRYSFKRYRHDPSNSTTLANNSVLTIFEDSHRNLWIGTENGGADILNRTTNQFEHHTHKANEPNSLISNSIWSIYEDRARGLWFGTFNRGISKWDPNGDKFQYFALKPQNIDEQISSTVTSFYEQVPGKITVGTDGAGYFIWDATTQQYTQTTKNPKNPKTINCNEILTITADSKNILWLGTWGNGINIATSNIANNSFDKVYTYENIYSLNRDNENIMWIGTWGTGLRVVSDKWQNLHNYTHIDNDSTSISSNNIFATLKDSYNRVWIGTLYGLNLALGKSDSVLSFKKYYHQKSDTNTITSNTVLSLHEDLQRTLWVGTDCGLNKYDATKDCFVRVSNSRLTNVSVKSILEDGLGNLWLGTEKSLIMYNPRDNKAIAYDKSDGINTMSFSVGARLKTSDNSFLFGGKNGFIKFYPDSVKSNNFIPQVHIIDFKVFNKSIISGSSAIIEKSILFTKEIELSYKQSVFSIEFVALNFTHPEKNQYAYMLDGLEKEWNFVGNQRSASYSNLAPGEYTFMVKASNNDAVWNETPLKLRITVTPPFWNTTWFKLLLAALVLWAIYTIYVARLRKINERIENQERLYKSKQSEAETEIIKLQKDKLDAKLDYTNMELASTTMNIMQKNEKLISLRDQLMAIIPTTDTATQRKLKLVTKEIDEELENEKKWDRFESNFDLIHDNFIKRFTELYPKITHNDLKLCAFIRMNLSNKEIANLLNITLRSVESSRYRIRKKMEIDSEINLNDYIMRF